MIRTANFYNLVTVAGKPTVIIVGVFTLDDMKKTLTYYDNRIERLLTKEEFVLKFGALMPDFRDGHVGDKPIHLDDDPVEYYEAVLARYTGTYCWVGEPNSKETRTAEIIVEDKPKEKYIRDLNGELTTIPFRLFDNDMDPDDIDDTFEPDDLQIMLEAGAKVGVDITEEELKTAGFTKDENGEWQPPGK